MPLVEPQNFTETAGRGVKADVGGAKVLVGRAQWLKDNGVKDDFEKSVDLNETEGWSLIFVARDGQCIGWVGLQDQTRAEAKEALAELQRSRRAPHRDGERRPPARGHARGGGDRLRRSQGRMPAAEQGRVRPRHEGQGLPGRGHRRRRE